eukprot:12938498-Prorocentrum_lima.AAC.1
MSNDLSHERTIDLPLPTDVFEMFVPHESMTIWGVQYLTVVCHEGLLCWIVNIRGGSQPGTRSRW